MDTKEKLVQLMMAYQEEQNAIVVGKRALADHLIANGVTVQEWIPVSEPPKEYGRYYCKVKSFAFPGSFYYAIFWHDKYGFRDGNVYEDGVTLWTELPEPPKGD